MSSRQHREYRQVRILTAEKIADLNDDDLRRYRIDAGDQLREEKRSSVRWPAGAISEEEQKRINALTWAFREAERETARRV
jgi:hypothetical protein